MFQTNRPTGALFIIQRFSDHQHPVSGPIPWANELTYVTLVNRPFGLGGGRRLRHHDPLSLVQRPNHGFWALSRFIVALGSCGWHPPISRFLVSVFWSRLLSALTHWIHRHASCVSFVFLSWLPSILSPLVFLLCCSPTYNASPPPFSRPQHRRPHPPRVRIAWTALAPAEFRSYSVKEAAYTNIPRDIHTRSLDR